MEKPINIYCGCFGEYLFFVKEGRRRKANRWLGFVQGFLWANGIYTIEEMKEHNRPDENK